MKLFFNALIKYIMGLILVGGASVSSGVDTGLSGSMAFYRTSVRSYTSFRHCSFHKVAESAPKTPQ